MNARSSVVPTGANLAGNPHVLRSSDAAEIAAFTAEPRRATSTAPTGVVVLPDIRGLAPCYESLCTRLADEGHPATAIDWHSRTAGAAPALRPQPFPQLVHVAALSRSQMQDDVMSAVAHLRGIGCAGVMALGFCAGGRLAFLMSAERFRLAGVIGFYGAPGAVGPYDSGPTGLAHELSAPILALFGEADEGITPQAIKAFDDALSEAGVIREIVTFPGAPHGFFDVDQGEHAEACADSWKRVLAFLARYR